MSRTLKDARDTESMLQRLTNVLEEHSTAGHQSGDYSACHEDALSLRRISMTLHRWHELECGTDGGCIERGHYIRPSQRTPEERERGITFHSDENGKPYFANHNGERTRYTKMPDREAGAQKRLAKIMQRYPSLASWVQGDPRGCSLYVLRPGDVPEGADVSAFYSRGLAVHQ